MEGGDNEGELPLGWKRYKNDRGRVQYDSPPPITHIRSKSELFRYQKAGKFKELDSNNISFMVKQKRCKKVDEDREPNPTLSKVKEENFGLPAAQETQDIAPPLHYF